MKDGSVDWIPLKNLKQSNPVGMSEYSVKNEISDELSFNCWIKDTVRHRDSIMYKVKSKYWRTSHNFGIWVSKKVKETYYIYRQSGTDFWTKDIAKEMTNVRILFKKLDGVTPYEVKKREDQALI